MSENQEIAYTDIIFRRNGCYKYERKFENLPKAIENAYNEAWESFLSKNWTASTLMSRKLLMNMACSFGAKEGLKFVEYINFLIDNHIVANTLKPVLERVRKTGNEATHEIPTPTEKDALICIRIVQILLDQLYEAPCLV